MYSYIQLHAVTYNALEDVEHKNYLNLSKNTLKIKCNLVFFSLFVSATGLLALLLFNRFNELDYWSSHL